MTLDYGTAIVLPDAPTREGYEFAGWAEEVPETMPDRDLVLNATWNVLQYTVKFVVDGVAVYEESLDYGTVVTKPADPVKEGYTFAGWDPEFVEGTTVPVGGLTYNATWNVNYYTLTFKWNDVVYSTASVAYGSAITAPETPEREGYEFTGWTPEVPEVMPAEDTAQVGSIRCGVCLCRCSGHRGDNYCDQNGNYRYDDEHFYEGEALFVKSLFHGSAFPCRL